MSKNSSATKTAHLGMPYGTAMHQLRKQIVFRMAQRLSEDFCFKCGLKIETVEELSIDHKKAWLHGEQSLFWDLDNIAFSHRLCNRPDRLAGRKPREAPLGTAWCCGCQAFLIRTEFTCNRSTWNGLQKNCRGCFRVLRERAKQRRADAL